MRVIFLDIDGVLSDRTIGCTAFSDAAADRVRQLAERAGAVIVITSAWRGGDNLYRELRRTGLMRYGVGETPRLLFDGKHWPTRGDEIRHWISQHADYVERFVILDDDDDMGELRDSLVRVQTLDGLIRDEHCDRAVAMLMESTA